MVLRVEFEQFAAACKKLLKVEEVFLTERGSGTLATAGEPGKGLIVATVGKLGFAEAKAALEESGVKVSSGEWSLSGEGLEINEAGCELHVGAVAYHSKDSKPGLWIDAFAEPRNQTQVLRAMFDELRETGEMPEVSFEEFIRLANPNVIVLAPSDLMRFVEQSAQCL
jgi:hypothetical protein